MGGKPIKESKEPSKNGFVASADEMDKAEVDRCVTDLVQLAMTNHADLKYLKGDASKAKPGEIRSALDETLQTADGMKRLDELRLDNSYKTPSKAKEVVEAELDRQYPRPQAVVALPPAPTNPALVGFSYAFRRDTYTGNDALIALIFCKDHSQFDDFSSELVQATVSSMRSVAPPALPANQAGLRGLEAADYIRKNNPAYVKQCLDTFSAFFDTGRQTRDSQVTMMGDNMAYIPPLKNVLTSQT